MLKLQRNYRAEFEIGYRNEKQELIPQEKLTVAYPFTCEFDIECGTYQSANRGIFSFINLYSIVSVFSSIIFCSISN